MLLETSLIVLLFGHFLNQFRLGASFLTAKFAESYSEIVSG